MKPNDKAYQEAADAAQFQNNDYAGLVEELRDASHCHQCVASGEKAADALEAVLAERDRLNGVIQSYQILLETQQGMLVATQTERDALLARLAPLDDKELVEIAKRALIDVFKGGGTIYSAAARAAIVAIRPHIEAAERERCAKKLDEACELLHKLTAIIPGNDGAGEEVAKFLRSAPIRSGK